VDLDYTRLAGEIRDRKAEISKERPKAGISRSPVTVLRSLLNYDIFSSSPRPASGQGVVAERCSPFLLCPQEVDPGL